MDDTGQDVGDAGCMTLKYRDHRRRRIEVAWMSLFALLFLLYAIVTTHDTKKLSWPESCYEQGGVPYVDRAHGYVTSQECQL